ncbi:hypothetical protein [Bacillus toyonensis]|uniref:hypothetical protein n=1 Tax=Bacillus toyonensis TaxID=155322 RepID=UPI0015D46EC9|nr:hypothetical protein [Bacillus toyonensis]
MDWLIILGTLTAVATFFSQVSTVVKNSVDTYYILQNQRGKRKESLPPRSRLRITPQGRAISLVTKIITHSI